MLELADLERQRPDEAFRVLADDSVMEFSPATEVRADLLVYALSDWHPFLSLLVVDQEALVSTSLTVWQAEYLVRAYRSHYGLCLSPVDDQRLVGLLGKPEYIKAIERDLQEVYGLDLTTEWRARRWRKLLNSIDGLRRTSHLHEVMVGDEQLAELILARERDNEPKDPTRRVSEFSTEAEILSVVADRIGELIQITMASRGVNPRRLAPMPRPTSAYEKAKRRRAFAHHNFTVARIRGLIDAQGNPTGGGMPPAS